MDAQTATLVGVLVSVLLHAGIAVWYYGRLSERVSNHGTWLNSLDRQVTDHETRISRLEGREGGNGQS